MVGKTAPSMGYIYINIYIYIFIYTYIFIYCMYVFNYKIAIMQDFSTVITCFRLVHIYVVISEIL